MLARMHDRSNLIIGQYRITKILFLYDFPRACICACVRIHDSNCINCSSDFFVSFLI